MTTPPSVLPSPSASWRQTQSRAGTALIAGTIAGIVTMAFHPTSRLAMADVTSGGHNALNIAVHTLALAAEPLLLAGMLAVTVRLRNSIELATTAFLAYLLATIAVTVAAVASGLIASSVIADLPGTTGAAHDAAMSALRYTGQVNQAFAKADVGLSCVAFALWSIAMLRDSAFSRALAWYGLVIAVAQTGLLISGHLPLDVHHFGLVVFTQGVWIVWTALALRGDAARSSFNA